jgi:pimeloyl-ACP methyl ester carboxylesterase
MKYRANGVELHVKEQGQGDITLVFIHFYGGSLRTWGPVIEGLKGDFRCVAYDQRGWGDSDKSATSYRIEDLADDAQALIEELGLKRYAIVGHSMGGKAAQLLASHRPKGLEALILIAPATPTPQMMPEEFRNAMAHFYDNREGAEMALSNIAFLPIDEPIREMLLEDMQNSAPLARKAWPQIAMLEDISEQVRNIDVPTLILAGESDPVDSLESIQLEIVKRISNTELIVIPHTGHLSPVEVPTQIIKAIVEFLN